MGAGYRITAKADTAEVFLYEDIGEGWFGGVSAKAFAADLKALGPVSQIDLRINSYGGEVFDGLAIYNTLKDHKAKVISHIDGVAASIASVIAMAGDEIQIAEAGFLMIHNASGLVIGEAADMRRMADVLDTVSGTIADVYVARSGADRQQVLDWMTAETWFAGPDAVTNGLADSMVENMRVAAHARISAKHKFQHAPAALTGALTASEPLRLVPPAEAVPAAALTTPPAAAAATFERANSARAQLERMQARLTLAR